MAAEVPATNQQLVAISDSGCSEPPKKRSRKGIKTNRLSEDTRLLFLEDALADGVKSACRKYGVPKSTAYNLLQLWDPTAGGKSVERMKPGPEPGHASKMTDEVKAFLKKRLGEVSTITGLQLAKEVKESFKISISKTTVNKFLAKENFTTKSTTTEDVLRNTPQLIDERFQFAQLMLDKGERPEDPSSIIYWDITYFENCIVGRRGRAKRGEPAVVKKGHRGVYIPVDEQAKKKKSRKKRKIAEPDTGTVAFTADTPTNMKGGKCNSVAVFAAISGSEVLLARSQLRHFTSTDSTQFFTELLQKLDATHPTKKFTFIGDNEGVYAQAMELFKDEKYKRHTVIPNPRYSPFLNAIEYLFSQLKHHVRGQQYKTLHELIESIQHAFELVNPAHLHNYHKTVGSYLLQCLRKEEIHAWKTKLGDEKDKSATDTKQKWDVKHRTVFTTEKEALNKPMVKDGTTNPPKPSKAAMIKNGQEVPIYDV
jgi:transposase